jgi:hypothetical protein
MKSSCNLFVTYILEPICGVCHVLSKYIMIEIWLNEDLEFDLEI